MIIAPMVRRSSSMMPTALPEGAKYQSCSPLSSLFGPATKPSSDMSISTSTVPTSPSFLLALRCYFCCILLCAKPYDLAYQVEGHRLVERKFQRALTCPVHRDCLLKLLNSY